MVLIDPSRVRKGAVRIARTHYAPDHCGKCRTRARALNHIIAYYIRRYDIAALSSYCEAAFRFAG